MFDIKKQVLAFSLMASLGIAETTGLGFAEVDLVFPRNGTFGPMTLTPIVFAIQNSAAIDRLYPYITYGLWPVDLPPGSQTLDSFLVQHHLPNTTDTTGSIAFLEGSIANTLNTENDWEFVWRMDWTNCSLPRFLGGLLGQACKSLGNIYEAIMSAVPLLTTFAKWESFATEVAPTNPGPGVAGSGSRPEPSPSNPTTELAHEISELGSPATPDEEPEYQLAVYWQTLCTGTYDAAANASGRGRKIASQKLFYNWRASLKPLYQLHRWYADRMLRPLGFVGYVVNTYRMFSEFTLFLEGSYGRRLGRAANGYLCLVPAAAEAGDKVILARGERVPLVVREDGGTGYWRLVGEAYVHGIMDGETWEEDKCKEFQVR